MSKKRPRATPAPLAHLHSAISKQNPQYWLKRLFKSRYTYKSKQFEVRNWSVKIQHLGKRKTFSLRSGRRSQAAAEACGLYRTLVMQGWRDETSPGGLGSALSNPARGGQALPGMDKFAPAYWERRLIHREYSMSPDPAAIQELSVRMDHAGTGYYFPLGTNDYHFGARRALRIYQTIASQGWDAANKRFSREMTVAFRWLDVPLAWTYTTIHTQNSNSQNGSAQSSNGSTDACRVAVTESDAGIRHALAWCLDHMNGYRCVAAYATAAEALRDSPGRGIHLALVRHTLDDKPGTVCLAELKAAVPEVLGLLYSAYEDSEELFRTTPGGAGIYLLRRTLPTQFLEPIAGRLKHGGLLGEEMASAAWQYFKDSFSSVPMGGATRQLANLTEREHEVLSLLSKGHPDKDIADRLRISIHTVHEHVRNIFEKLQVHNRTEAVVKFLQK